MFEDAIFFPHCSATQFKVLTLPFIMQLGIHLEVRNWPPFLPSIHYDTANEIPVYLQKLLYVAFSTFLGMCFSKKKKKKKKHS